MRVTIPWNDRFPLFKLDIDTPAGVNTMTLDDSHHAVEVALPEGVCEDDVRIVGQPLNNRGEPASALTIIKERVERPKPQPQPWHKPAKACKKPEPAVEPVAEPAAPPAEPVAEQPATESDHSET